jgi:hypothetical protein
MTWWKGFRSSIHARPGNMAGFQMMGVMKNNTALRWRPRAECPESAR